MKMLTERTSKILESAIQGFIDTGEPISSGWLFDRYNFGIRSAMIRHELEALSEMGFLEQPHHSAGRIPTDKGYEFFAETVIKEDCGSAPGAEKLARFLEKGAFPDFFEEFSENLGLAGAIRAKEKVHKGGIESLIENFDWGTANEIKSVMRDFVLLEERLEKIADQFISRPSPTVFIGKKSPITKSEYLTVMFGSYDGEKGKTSIVALGPKRMNYKKTIKVLKNLKHARK